MTLHPKTSGTSRPQLQKVSNHQLPWRLAVAQRYKEQTGGEECIVLLDVMLDGIGKSKGYKKAS